MLVRLAACAAPILVGSACSVIGGGGTAHNDDPVGVGDIQISGSSTVEPISVAVAESYRSIDPALPISVLGPGTGAGFRAYCDGETDIADASRQITDAEAIACAEKEIPFLELPIAVDGIAVVANEKSSIGCLSFVDLYALTGPESAGREDWSAVGELAGEIGSTTTFEGFGNGELAITAPGTDSGTYDMFAEIALAEIAAARGQPVEVRDDHTSVADASIIVERLASRPGGIGWVGFAAANEAEGVATVPISREPGGPCVLPTPETIASGDYPLTRDLYLYVNTFHARKDPAVVGFVDHYMAFGLDDAVAAAGFVPLSEEAKAATRAEWEDAVVRTAE
jgi:phosphate transport system substrate-binding protein